MNNITKNNELNEKQKHQEVNQTLFSTFKDDVSTQDNKTYTVTQVPDTNVIEKHVSKQKDWNEWLDQLPIQDKAHIFQCIGQSSTSTSWHGVDLQLNNEDLRKEEKSDIAQRNNDLVKEDILQKDAVGNNNEEMEEDTSKHSSCFEKVGNESSKGETDDYSWEDDFQNVEGNSPENLDPNVVQNDEDNVSMHDQSESSNSVGEVVGNYNPPNDDVGNNSGESSLGSEREPTRYSF